MSERHIDIQATARANAGVHCSYCRDVFSDGISGEPCGACGTRLHRSCWGELKGGCPTTGCPGGWKGAVVAHDPSVTEHCAACGDGLLPRAGAPCSGCGARLHRFCWDELPCCPRPGCDGGWTRGRGSGAGPLTRTRPDSAWTAPLAPADPDAPFGSRTWFLHWIDQDPLTRGLTLAPHCALWAFLSIAVFGGMVGAVNYVPHFDFSLTGLLFGAALSIPGAAAGAAYGFLQGLVGVQREFHRNGGVWAVGLAIFLAVVGYFYFPLPVVGGVLGGVVGLLLGVRAFGLHFETDG